jgi:hypothetical protein
MAESKGPADPITALAEGAAQLHELFMAYVDAGFSHAQAIYLVGVTLRSAIGRQPDA